MSYVLSPEDLARISGPDLAEMIVGHRNRGVLDGRRWGRFLPASQVDRGTGHPRRLSVKDAAVTWACVDFATGAEASSTPRGPVAAAGEVIAAHCHGVTRLPAFAAWTARRRFVFTDDAAEVVAVAQDHGGARIVPLYFYVERVRSWLDHRTEGTASASVPAVPDASSYPRSVVPSVGWSGPTERHIPRGVTPPSGGPGRPVIERGGA